MRCLYCGKRLSLLHKLSGREFCGDEHYALYMQDQESLGLARLIEAKQQATRTPPQRKKSSRAAPAPGNLPALAEQFQALTPEPQDDIRLAQPPTAPVRESMLVALPRIEVNLAGPGIGCCAPQPLFPVLRGCSEVAGSGQAELAVAPVAEVLPSWSPAAVGGMGSLAAAGPVFAALNPLSEAAARPDSSLAEAAPVLSPSLENVWPVATPVEGRQIPEGNARPLAVAAPAVPSNPPEPPRPTAAIPRVADVALPGPSSAPLQALQPLSWGDLEKVHARTVPSGMAPLDIEREFHPVPSAAPQTGGLPKWLFYPEAERYEDAAPDPAGFADAFLGSLEESAPEPGVVPEAIQGGIEVWMPAVAALRRRPTFSRPGLLRLPGEASCLTPQRQNMTAEPVFPGLSPRVPRDVEIAELPGLPTVQFDSLCQTKPSAAAPPPVAVQAISAETVGENPGDELPAPRVAVNGLPAANGPAAIATAAPAAAWSLYAAPEPETMPAHGQIPEPRFDERELSPSADLMTAVAGFGCETQELLPLSLDRMAPLEGAAIHQGSLELIGRPPEPVVPRAVLDPVRESFAAALAANDPSVPVWKRLVDPVADTWHRVPPLARWGLMTLPLLAILAARLLDNAPAVSASTTSSGDGMTTALAQRWEVLQENIMSRAAISLSEDFRSGLAAWEGDGDWAKSWSYDSAGFIRPGSLALYRPSIPLADYQFEFAAQLEHLSWVFRAADTGNYHAARLVVTDPGPMPKAALVRYAVVDGRKGKTESKEIPVTLRNEKMYRIRVDVRGSSFTTYIDDQVVDFFRDDRLASGGVGFFRHGREAPRLRWVGVTHQYDMLGRLCALIAPYNMENPPRSWNQ